MVKAKVFLLNKWTYEGIAIIFHNLAVKHID
jgi:hypothetical protein